MSSFKELYAEAEKHTDYWKALYELEKEESAYLLSHVEALEREQKVSQALIDRMMGDVAELSIERMKLQKVAEAAKDVWSELATIGDVTPATCALLGQSLAALKEGEG